jgi:hypothetical protein
MSQPGLVSGKGRTESREMVTMPRPGLALIRTAEFGRSGGRQARRPYEHFTPAAFGAGAADLNPDDEAPQFTVDGNGPKPVDPLDP